MKNPIFLFLYFAFTSILSAEFAIINDKDGYTNVRSGPSTKSKVIDKIVEGQVFTVFDNQQEWPTIYYEKEGLEKKGFIHKSRIQYIEKAKTYTGKELTFTILSQPFSKEGKKFEKNENGGVMKIDGREIYGVDGNMPTSEIKEVKITLNGKALKVDKKLYSNLYQANPDPLAIKKINNHYYIIGYHSDGAGGYGVVWSVSTKGKVTNRVEDF